MESKKKESLFNEEVCAPYLKGKKLTQIIEFEDGCHTEVYGEFNFDGFIRSLLESKYVIGE